MSSNEHRMIGQHEKYEDVIVCLFLATMQKEAECESEMSRKLFLILKN